MPYELQMKIVRIAVPLGFCRMNTLKFQIESFMWKNQTFLLWNGDAIICRYSKYFVSLTDMKYCVPLLTGRSKGQENLVFEPLW